MEKLIPCSRCETRTNSDYVAKDEGILCSKCASKEIAKEEKILSNEIFRLKARMVELENQRQRLIRLDCRHNWKSIGYSVTLKGTKKKVFVCEDCDAVDYREE